MLAVFREIPRAYRAAIRRGGDVTVVDPVQSGVAFLLPCLNFSGVRLEFMPLCFTCRGAAMSQMRIPQLKIAHFRDE